MPERRPHVENEEERKAKRQRVVSAAGMKATVRDSVGGGKFCLSGEYLAPFPTEFGNHFDQSF